MKKVPSNLREVKLSTDAGLTSGMDLEEAVSELDVRVALIQALIPLGLEAVKEALQGEVNGLSGQKNSRKGGKTPNRRWGSQPGSVYLSDQKVTMPVPRVRDVEANEEVLLEVYHRLQRPKAMDEGLPASRGQRHCHAFLRELRRGGARGVWLVFVDGLEAVH